ncbi:MAG: hypothetical protein M1837_001582 [Sclerophora amabilis]|nr:MAG: hypothetical protein M1837_001582 [Sclerophora amabilis]
MEIPESMDEAAEVNPDEIGSSGSDADAVNPDVNGETMLELLPASREESTDPAASQLQREGAENHNGDGNAHRQSEREEPPEQIADQPLDQGNEFIARLVNVSALTSRPARGPRAQRSMTAESTNGKRKRRDSSGDPVESTSTPSPSPAKKSVPVTAASLREPRRPRSIYQEMTNRKLSRKSFARTRSPTTTSRLLSHDPIEQPTTNASGGRRKTVAQATPKEVRVEIHPGSKVGRTGSGEISNTDGDEHGQQSSGDVAETSRRRRPRRRPPSSKETVKKIRTEHRVHRTRLRRRDEVESIGSAESTEKDPRPLEDDNPRKSGRIREAQQGSVSRKTGKANSPSPKPRSDHGDSQPTHSGRQDLGAQDKSPTRLQRVSARHLREDSQKIEPSGNKDEGNEVGVDEEDESEWRPSPPGAIPEQMQETAASSPRVREASDAQPSETSSRSRRPASGHPSASNITTHPANNWRDPTLRRQRELLRSTLAGVRELGVSREGGITTVHYFNRDLPLQDPVVITLVEEIGRAKETYESIQDDERDQQTSVRLDRRLKEVDAVISSIGTTNKSHLEDAERTIQEIYAFCIPGLVRLLKIAFNTHRSDSQIESPALRQLSKIQGMILTLGKTAKAWKTKPRSSLNLVKPTRNRILRSVREMQKIIRAELQERNARAKSRRESAALDEYDEEREERIRHEEERNINEIIDRRRRIIERLAQVQDRTDPKGREKRHREFLVGSQLPSTLMVSTSPHSSQRRRPRTQLDQLAIRDGRWEQTEVVALFQGLEQFTGHDRYTQILHHSGRPGQPLQHRDLDALFKKAKEMRADLLADMESHPGPLPPWIQSI